MYRAHTNPKSETHQNYLNNFKDLSILGWEQALSGKGGAGESLIDPKTVKTADLVKAEDNLTLANSSIQKGLVRMASETVSVVVPLLVIVLAASPAES